MQPIQTTLFKVVIILYPQFVNLPHPYPADSFLFVWLETLSQYTRFYRQAPLLKFPYGNTCWVMSVRCKMLKFFESKLLFWLFENMSQSLHQLHEGFFALFFVKITSGDEFSPLMSTTLWELTAASGNKLCDIKIILPECSIYWCELYDQALAPFGFFSHQVRNLCS